MPPKPVAFFGNGFGGLWAWGFELGPKKSSQGTVWNNYDNVMTTPENLGLILKAFHTKENTSLLPRNILANPICL